MKGDSLHVRHDILYKLLPLKLVFFFYQGQYPFNISLTEPLPDDVTSGMAEFEGVGTVTLKKMNPYTFSGFVPGN